MMISWKKGYTIVNKEGGCDHLFKKLNLDSQMELFHLHVSGHSHGLHKLARYEGTAVALRILVEGHLIERREEKVKLTIKEYLEKQLGSELWKGKGASVWTHGIAIDLGMTLKELLEEWNYNDGWCYLKVVCSY